MAKHTPEQLASRFNLTAPPTADIIEALRDEEILLLLSECEYIYLLRTDRPRAMRIRDRYFAIFSQLQDLFEFEMDII